MPDRVRKKMVTSKGVRMIVLRLPPQQPASTGIALVPGGVLWLAIFKGNEKDQSRQNCTSKNYTFVASFQNLSHDRYPER